jgi:hypothetical protein
VSDEWRWADPQGQQRLLRGDELRAALSDGVLAPNTPVWRRGWTEWRAANEVPELMSSALAAENGVVLNVPPPPLFVVTAQSEFEGKPNLAEVARDEPPPPPRYVPIPTAKKSDSRTVGAAKTEAAAKRPDVPKNNPKADVPKPEPTKVSPTQAPQPVAKVPLKSVSETKGPAPAPLGNATAKPAEAPRAKPAEKPAEPALKAAEKPAAGPLKTVVGVPALDLAGKAAEPTPAPTATAALAGALAKKPTKPPPPVPKKSEAPPPTVKASDAPAPPKRLDTPTAMPAPPPLPVAASAPASPAPPTAATRPQPSVTKNPTLLDFAEAAPPKQLSPTAGAQAPIVVPAARAVQPGAVTQPPPPSWSEGAVAEPVPRSPKAPTVETPIEELSGSILLPESDSHVPPAPVEELSTSELQSDASIPSVTAVKPPPLGTTGTLLGMAPPPLKRPEKQPDDDETETKAARTSKDVEEVVPRPPASRAGLHDMRELLREQPPARRGALLALGALVAVGMLGLGVRACSGGAADTIGPTASTSAKAGTTLAATTTASTAATATTAAVASTAAPPPPPAPKPLACALAGEERVVGPKAMVPSGVEVGVFGGSAVLGFAVAAREPVLVPFDLGTGSAGTAHRLKASDTVRRVTPLAANKGVADVDRKGDELQGRRLIATSPPIEIGASDASLAWAPAGTEKITKLAPLGAEGNVEAVRGVPTDSGFAYVYRQAGAVWVGAAKGDGKAYESLGEPLRIPGLGPQVGSPALAASGDTVLVAWSDRPSAEAPWGIRLLAWKPGTSADAAQAFPIPPGGMGEQAMSPGLAALPNGQFLLVWTEGPVASHQVRAQVLDASGKPSGAALTISGEGVNAGQGQAAIGKDGRGAVAFLASTGKGFEVRAAPLACKEP